MIYLCKVNKQEKLLVMQWWTFNYIDKSTNEFFMNIMCRNILIRNKETGKILRFGIAVSQSCLSITQFTKFYLRIHCKPFSYHIVNSKLILIM